MSAVWNWDLIHLFNFYLALVFLLSFVFRIRQYEAIVRLARALPDRWPRLLGLIKQHRTIFLSFGSLLPALVALGLCLLNMLACRLVWPHAQLTIRQLVEVLPALPFVVLAGLIMLAVDIYATAWVTDINRAEVEKYFDQAEFWLRSWTAPVVRVFTFGRINPRQMVNAEVRKALIDVSQSINGAMWWLAVQTGLRITYGLSLWLTFAFATYKP
jgi:hypothetical protein